jgi:hypothetical protein
VCDGIPQLRVSNQLSAAAADAFQLGHQQFVTLIRRGLDVGVVAVATAACERSVATETPAKSVNAPGIGRVGQCRQKRRPQNGRDDSGSRHARHPKPFLMLDHADTIGPLKGGIGAATFQNIEAANTVIALRGYAIGFFEM